MSPYIELLAFAQSIFHLDKKKKKKKKTEKDLDEIVNQLPTPFLLLGDFNGHNFIWGSDDVNDEGRIVENVINKTNLCFYNAMIQHICIVKGIINMVFICLVK